MAIMLAFPAYGLDSDNNPNDYINEQFPKLSELYRDELLIQGPLYFCH